MGELRKAEVDAKERHKGQYKKIEEQQEVADTVEEELEKLKAEHVVQTDKARAFQEAYEGLTTALGRHTCVDCKENWKFSSEINESKKHVRIF